MKSLTIPDELLRRCFAHGAEGYPDEVCGVIIGPEGESDQLTEAVALANILNRLHASDPQHYPRTAREGYVLDPKEHMLLERRLGQEQKAIRVIYHTHVDVGAYFSQEDTKRALWEGEPLYPGVAYLVCGIRERQPDGAVLAWFDPATGKFTESRLLPQGAGVPRG
jgi:proteasome lid subunit RPN8/RPN11